MQPLPKARSEAATGTQDEAENLRNGMAVERSYPTLRQQAVEQLRRAIVQGQLPPGTRLVERKLCDLLDVSRSIVRESLGQLEAEGWITKEPYKGPTVAVMDEDAIRQIFEMRAALEGRAAAMCAQRATAEQIERLEATIAVMDEASASGHVEAQIAAIEAFYEALLAGAANVLMADYLASQRNRLARLRRLSLSRSSRAAVSVEEKRRILTAIRSRDAAAAQALAEQHVWNSSESLLAAVRGEQANG